MEGNGRRSGKLKLVIDSIRELELHVVASVLDVMLRLDGDPQ